jgi:biotin operon repressor
MAGRLSKGEKGSPSVANPQPIPFVQVSKELFDALLRSGMPPTHKLLVFAVIRLTYGEHGAKSAPISQSLLQTKTGLSRTGVKRHMDSLLAEGVITEVTPCTHRKPAILKLNKNYEKWGQWSVEQLAESEGPDWTPSPDIRGSEVNPQRVQIEPSRGSRLDPREGPDWTPVEEENIEEEEKRTSPSRTKKKETPLNGSAKWVGEWVIALEANGDVAPTKWAKDVFGAKCKTIPNLDPDIMKDCIARMVEQGKHPGVVALVYGDCAKQAEREIFNMRKGGYRGR